MGAAITLVSVEQYLRTSFPDGDREFVDGEIVERHIGERDHSRALGEVLFALHDPRRVHAYPSLRIRVSSTRVRIPDVCLYAGSEPNEDVPTTPPFLVVEILSRDDRASEIQEKIDDYLRFGVPYVWVIDPRLRRGWIHTVTDAREAKDGVLRTADPDLALPLAELFGRANA